MKIIHTSDLHLDSPLKTRLSGAELRARKAELVANFRRLAEEGRKCGAKIIIIAGDMFDTKRISVRTLDSVNSVINAYPDIDFLYLKGNHECDAFSESMRSMPNNLKIFGDEWTYFDYRDVTVAGRSTLSPDLFDSLKLLESKINIAVLHGAVEEKSDYLSIGIKDAADKGISYLALGHYHTYKTYDISGGGVAVYSGTPEGRGFDEAGVKGYVLIDTDEGLSYKFVPFAKRTVRIIEVDITGARKHSEIESAVASSLEGVGESDLVRVVLVGKKEPLLKPSAEDITARWGGRYFYFEVKDASGIRINPDDYALDKSLKGEFIRLVSREESLSEKERDAIISLGLSALMGEID